MKTSLSQVPEEVPLCPRGPDAVPAPHAGRRRDPVLLRGRLDPVQPGDALPAEDQSGGQLHPAVSVPGPLLLLIIIIIIIIISSSYLIIPISISYSLTLL